MKKKLLSLVLALAMICSMLCIGGVTAFAETTQWDGNPATSFSQGGNGTKENPYKIATAEELKLFANIVNGLNLTADFSKNTAACAVLTSDIVLNNGTFTADASGNPLYNGEAVSDTNKPNEWFPIGYFYDTDGVDGKEDVYFNGTFNGQNHTVSGLYFNNASQEYVGLFGQTDANSVISNVSIVNSYIKGDSYVGGVCGSNGSDATVSNCYNTGKVSGTENVGGVCGRNDGKIKNCYNTGNIDGNTTVGGVCGYNVFSIINCYNTGNIDGDNYVGGVCGYQYYSTITNSYYLDTSCTTSAGGTSKATAQFASGEVAYLLNGSTSDGELTWFMKDGIPTLDKLGDIAIYENGIYSTKRNPNNPYYNTALTYNVDPTYTVTIDPTVTLGGSLSVSAENVVVDEGKQVNVKLTATSGVENAFTVATAKGATLSYEIVKNGDTTKTPLAIGDTVLSVNPKTGATGNTTLIFSKPTGAQFSGTYTGTVTFTVSVDDVPLK